MIITISLFFIGAAVILGFIRLILGPTIPDRLLAADTLTTITTAIIALLSFMVMRVIYMDVAIVYAVLGFVGVVTVARYLEGGI
ncbi:cation:proton antiporter [bacterium]|nr:cation:proton antiporter [bacterium]